MAKKKSNSKTNLVQTKTKNQEKTQQQKSNYSNNSDISQEHQEMMNTTRAQVMLQFLVQYGWMFLIILVVAFAGQYYGLFDASSIVPSKCDLGNNWECHTFKASEEAIQISLTSRINKDVQIESIKLKSNDDDEWCHGTLEIPPYVRSGEKIDLTLLIDETDTPCESAMNDGTNEKKNFQIEIDYVTIGTSLEQRDRGSSRITPSPIEDLTCYPLSFEDACEYTDCGLEDDGCGNTVNCGPCQELCGNEELDETEECDGSKLNDKTCSDFAYDAGIIDCKDDCSFDLIGCYNHDNEPSEGPVCGNNVKESGEDCDGQDLSGYDCRDFGYSEINNLYCENCEFKNSECNNICGDGHLEPNEECDDGNINSGDGCSNTCVIEFCGDGKFNNYENEICDTSDFGQKTCLSESGLSGGNLDCNDECNKITTNNCIPICGDGLVQSNEYITEECDDGNTIPNDGCSEICQEESIFVDGTLDLESTMTPVYPSSLITTENNKLYFAYGFSNLEMVKINLNSFSVEQISQPQITPVEDNYFFHLPKTLVMMDDYFYIASFRSALNPGELKVSRISSDLIHLGTYDGFSYPQGGDLIDMSKGKDVWSEDDELFILYRDQETGSENHLSIVWGSYRDNPTPGVYTWGGDVLESTEFNFAPDSTEFSLEVKDHIAYIASRGDLYKITGPLGNNNIETITYFENMAEIDTKKIDTTMDETFMYISYGTDAYRVNLEDLTYNVIGEGTSDEESERRIFVDEGHLITIFVHDNQLAISKVLLGSSSPDDLEIVYGLSDLEIGELEDLTASYDYNNNYLYAGFNNNGIMRVQKIKVNI